LTGPERSDNNGPMNRHLERKTRYPRRRGVRLILRGLIRVALATLTRFEVEGRENVPRTGPLVVAGNHFNFIDPVALIRAIPRPLEFVGGLRMPFAPRLVTFLPRLWGYYAVKRGTPSREALRAAEDVLRQGGAIGIFPEGGSWASVLRPPRGGAAFLAARTGALVVPVGLDGLTEVFPSLRRLCRAKVTVRIGRPIGPFAAPGKGHDHRAALDAIGDEILRAVSRLIPPERRGHYSDDPALREAAKRVERYPWDNAPET